MHSPCHIPDFVSLCDFAGADAGAVPPKQPAGPSIPASVPSSWPVSAFFSLQLVPLGSSYSDQCYQHSRQAFKQNTSMQELDLVKCLSKKHLLILKTLGGT